MTRAEKEGEGKREREKERERKKERERERERKREKKHRHGPPNTYALARTTLEITIGSLCQGPSRRFQGACKLRTRKKNLLDG